MKKSTLIIFFFSFYLITINGFSKNKEEEVESIDNSIIIDRITNDDIEVITPSVIFSFMDSEIKLKFKNPGNTKLLLANNKLDFIINGENKELIFVNGEAHFIHTFDKDNSLSLFFEDFGFSKKFTVYPLWAILLPFAMLIGWLIFRMRKK